VLFRSSLHNKMNQIIAKIIFERLRRSILIFTSVVAIWIGSARVHTAPCHATPRTSLAAPIERILSSTSRSLDSIVDGYVRRHMFREESYEPVESLYREAFEDATTASYPTTLQAIDASSMGGEVGARSVSRSSGEAGIGNLLTSAISTMQKRLNVGEGTAVAILAAMFVVAGPSAFLFMGMVIAGMSKRNINKVMKQRYGDTYTVDATIKTDVDVEAPEDDDDENDDDGEDDDDDDE